MLESKNIVLIGMPAGGKSTIGAAVARKPEQAVHRP